MKKIFISSIFFILAVIISFELAGCSSSLKTYSCDEGLSIELPDGFYEKSYISATYYLESSDSLFFAIKENFSDLATISIYSNSSLYDYAEIVLYQNKMYANIQTKDGITYFTYNRTVSGKDFFYFAAVFKGSSSFWLCQFACSTTDRTTFENKFLEWSKTIVVL